VLQQHKAHTGLKADNVCTPEENLLTDVSA
jgi:hypothetical protein